MKAILKVEDMSSKMANAKSCWEGMGHYWELAFLHSLHCICVCRSHVTVFSFYKLLLIGPQLLNNSKARTDSCEQ